MRECETYNEKLNTIFDKNESFYQNRLVAKIGSSTIMSANGQINHGLLDHYAWQTNELMNQGYEIAIVTSGSVACGRRKLTHLNGSASKQLLASVGQREIETAWASAFDKYNRVVGYSAYSERDLINLYQHHDNTLFESLESGLITIVNGNDAVNKVKKETVSISDDNDKLAGFVARYLQAGRLILLTESDGVKDREDQVIELMTRWSDISRIFVQEKTQDGTGGILSKVEVTMSFALNGRLAIIAHGQRERILLDIAEGRTIGTRVQMEV